MEFRKPRPMPLNPAFVKEELRRQTDKTRLELAGFNLELRRARQRQAEKRAARREKDRDRRDKVKRKVRKNG